MIAFPDLDKNFTQIGKLSDEEFRTDYNMWNSDSKICFLVLWLYSIEPPLYYHLNQACRQKNQELLSMLGPFAHCIQNVLQAAESSRRDKSEQGFQLHYPELNIQHELGYMAASSIVFRGCLLPAEMIS